MQDTGYHHRSRSTSQQPDRVDARPLRICMRPSSAGHGTADKKRCREQYRSYGQWNRRDAAASPRREKRQCDAGQVEQKMSDDSWDDASRRAPQHAEHQAAVQRVRSLPGAAMKQGETDSRTGDAGRRAVPRQYAIQEPAGIYLFADSRQKRQQQESRNKSEPAYRLCHGRRFTGRSGKQR